MGEYILISEDYNISIVILHMIFLHKICLLARRNLNRHQHEEVFNLFKKMVLLQPIFLGGLLILFSHSMSP